MLGEIFVIGGACPRSSMDSTEGCCITISIGKRENESKEVQSVLKGPYRLMLNHACNEWMEEKPSRKKYFGSAMTRRIVEPAFSTQLEETGEDNRAFDGETV